jgi:hypothetical protein
MTQQYVGHITEERYSWIAQLVEHPPGTRFNSSFNHFLSLLSIVILSRWIDAGCETFPSLRGASTKNRNEKLAPSRSSCDSIGQFCIIFIFNFNRKGPD